MPCFKCHVYALNGYYCVVAGIRTAIFDHGVVFEILYFTARSCSVEIAKNDVAGSAEVLNIA